MTEHYYTSQPKTVHKEKEIKATLKGNTLTFKTDSGVFSKDRIDYGSQVMIEAVNDAVFPGSKVLDVGCGYGPVGISLVKANPALRIDMIDVNERAIDLAEKNVKINNVENVRIFVSSLYDKVEDKDYSAILSNPPIRAGKETVHQIITDARDFLTDRGVLIIVIQKKQGAPSAKKKMEEVFGNVERLTQDKGYWVLQSVK